ncbi:MAG: HAMP domain-containing sensor histidine kinase [Eubacteriales bacterium]|nr:HAMP domain-containing sensor histidine kinase [Eubacteriales bacterium]
MRFTLKICLCTVLIVAILFAVAGQVLIAQSFNAALSFRVKTAQAEFSALASSMEAEIYGLKLYYNEVTPLMFQEVLARSAVTLQRAETTPCAIYDTNGVLIAEVGQGYSSQLEFSELNPRRFAYHLIKDNGKTVLDTAGCITIGSVIYYLCIRYDAADLIAMRNDEVTSVTLLHCITVAISILCMLVISYFASRSMRSLNNYARRIGRGNYSERAKVTSLDEIGDLTVSFNNMAGAIEQKVTALEGYAKQQKDFVASFSHELKTPMTSIIGYADMLRSAQMGEEDAFMAANFIFSEGKRLEAMSLKLMDLVVLDKSDYQLSKGYSRKLLGHVTAVVTPMLEKAQLELICDVEQQIIYYEKDLVLTLITNLVDNARKASSPGKRVYLSGRRQQNRYRISVRDEGIGIPKEEIARITEAFFMVDKSRARAQHGAGLGLAIANRIAQLHGSELHFESKVGTGTTVWFDVPMNDDKRLKGGEKV